MTAEKVSIFAYKVGLAVYEPNVAQLAKNAKTQNQRELYFVSCWFTLKNLAFFLVLPLDSGFDLFDSDFF
jgi:hypothetical protein